jgi:hypothetical protein
MEFRDHHKTWNERKEMDHSNEQENTKQIGVTMTDMYSMPKEIQYDRESNPELAADIDKLVTLLDVALDFYEDLALITMVAYTS